VKPLFWAIALLISSVLLASDTASELDRRIHTAGLDPDACYRVRELALIKEDIRLYFTEGFLILGNPVDGRRHTAVFFGEIEGGDGELLVMPPTRGERLSLATFAGAPNLSEHFRFALMVFSDDTGNTLLEEIRKQPRVRHSPGRGVLLADSWNSVTNNMTRSFATRLVYDRLAERPLSEGFFYGAIRGLRHGNFDVLYDPFSDEQVQVGQVRFHDDRPLFDVWTSFQSRAFRSGKRPALLSGFHLNNYRIDAQLDSDLLLEATTAGVLSIHDEPRRVLYFDIAAHMEVSEVLIDGATCEVWQKDALRANLFSGGTGLFLVIAPRELTPGRHTIEFRHRGKVGVEAGNGVYYVGARGTWYPFHSLDFSHYDITFRYPAGLNLVFTGEIIEDRPEGEWRVTRRKTVNPLRLVGFNVGQYASFKTEREGFEIEVFANQRVEKALEPERQVLVMPEAPRHPGSRTRMPRLMPIPVDPEAPDPTEGLELLAGKVAGAFEFMREHFGPPPTPSLTVSPIPGTFGQGFAGMLYLSTMAYLSPEDRPPATREGYQDYFYNEILHAHETGHQWWGNVVTSAGYRDEWIMEALANYSALMLLENRRGSTELANVLNQYRERLLEKNDEGETLDSAGPIEWGRRLDSSQASAYRIITYEKGSWIVHMLRRRLGDERFLEMLGELCRRYRYRTLTTQEFRDHVASFVPGDMPDRSLEVFFDQWVHDTGIPELEFSHRIRGKVPRVRVTGSVTQSGVADYASVLAPVEFRFPGGESVIRWLRTSDEPVTFDLTFERRPESVEFNPGQSTLIVRK